MVDLEVISADEEKVQIVGAVNEVHNHCSSCENINHISYGF